jgi:hypothetical protein
VAGDPDLGPLTNPKQQPVDFSIWQAADGTWQLWSCIRHTKEAGKTRLFHRWEGPTLTDRDWKPMGIAMQADPKVGEVQGGLQAPFVFRDGERYVMFYGGWLNICSATSSDGKTFQRKLNADGKAALFGADDGNMRDPMLLRIGALWHCYYANHTPTMGAVYCRTSPDLETWGAEHLVAKGGRIGSGPISSECPFVVEPEPGQFYLFRNHIDYGENTACSVFYSRDPLDFGIDHDAGHFVCTLPFAAPEVLRHEGQFYVASLLPSVKGIRIARMEWVATE